LSKQVFHIIKDGMSFSVGKLAISPFNEGFGHRSKVASKMEFCRAYSIAVVAADV
jgi:hypothetical protein